MGAVYTESHFLYNPIAEKYKYSTIYSYMMNEVRLSLKVDAWYKAAKARPGDRVFKDFERAIKALKDEWECTFSPPSTNPAKIERKGRDRIYERVAKDFGLPSLVVNKEELLWCWDGAEGRRIILYIAGGLQVHVLLYFLSHKEYTKYCRY